MTIRKLARAMLGADFDFLEAENGEQAHVVAKQSHPTLIVGSEHAGQMASPGWPISSAIRRRTASLSSF